MQAAAAALHGTPGAAWAVAGNASSAAAPRATEPAATPIDFRSFPMSDLPSARDPGSCSAVMIIGYHVWRAVKLEFRNVDRVRHGLVARVVRVQVVAAVVRGLHLQRRGRVAGRLVEVDDRVELVARADPVVHGAAGRLQGLVPDPPSLERQDGRAD